MGMPGLEQEVCDDAGSGIPQRGSFHGCFVCAGTGQFACWHMLCIIAVSAVSAVLTWSLLCTNCS